MPASLAADFAAAPAQPVSPKTAVHTLIYYFGAPLRLSHSLNHVTYQGTHRIAGLKVDRFIAHLSARQIRALRIAGPQDPRIVAKTADVQFDVHSLALGLPVPVAVSLTGHFSMSRHIANSTIKLNFLTVAKWTYTQINPY